MCFLPLHELELDIAKNANSLPEPELSETCANAASYFRTIFDAAVLLSAAYKELKVLVSLIMRLDALCKQV